MKYLISFLILILTLASCENEVETIYVSKIDTLLVQDTIALTDTVYVNNYDTIVINDTTYIVNSDTIIIGENTILGRWDNYAYMDGADTLYFDSDLEERTIIFYENRVDTYYQKNLTVEYITTNIHLRYYNYDDEPIDWYINFHSYNYISVFYSFNNGSGGTRLYRRY